MEKIIELGSKSNTSTVTSLSVPASSRDDQDSPDYALPMHSIDNISTMNAPYGGTTSSPDGMLSRVFEHHDDVFHLIDGKKNTTRSFYEREELDLNKYPCEESFSQCNDFAISDSSRFNLASSPSHGLIGGFCSGFSPCSSKGNASLNMKDDFEISNVTFQGNTTEDPGSNRGLSGNKDYSDEEFSGTKIVQAGIKVMLLNNDSSPGEKSSQDEDSEPSSVNDGKPHRCQLTAGGRGNGSSNDQDQDLLEESNRIENVKKERPEYSYESFESMVLKLPESNVDDYSVTSNQYELDETSSRDCGIKLRRGARRIKDFRKDVLPHLASLSSQEIWEDMKIMREALRSREYKRMRSKVQNEQSGSSPVKISRTRSNRAARQRKT